MKALEPLGVSLKVTYASGWLTVALVDHRPASRMIEGRLQLHLPAKLARALDDHRVRPRLCEPPRVIR